MASEMDGNLYAVRMETASIETEAAMERLRPSVIYRPKLMKDGNAWCALYGRDIMEGCCGFGDTPELAMAEFDKAWNGVAPTTQETSE